MGNFNKVILLGNLTRDIELRHTQNNQAVANFSVAVNRQWKDQSDETHEEATFVDCESWGRQAEVMHQYLGKGREVMLEGRLRMDRWQDKQSGANRSKLVVVVENFQFIGGRGESSSGASIETNRSRSDSGSKPASTGASPEDGDIPF